MTTCSVGNRNKSGADNIIEMRISCELLFQWRVLENRVSIYTPLGGGNEKCGHSHSHYLFICNFFGYHLWFSVL